VLLCTDVNSYSFVGDSTNHRSQFASLVENAVIEGRYSQWLGGLVVSALGMRTRRPRFESRVAPLFHWVATLGKLFTHIAFPVSQLQETGVQKGIFGA